MPQRLSYIGCVVTVVFFAATASPCRAQGFVEHLEPPVVERGKTTRVTVVGSNFGKALDLWTTLPAGAIKAVIVGETAPGRAMLDVTVAPNAPVGVCGGRLATIDGLGNAFLFLVDDLPVRAAAAEAKATKLPVALWERFREGGVDRFAIDVAAGQRVSFEAVGNRLGKDVDPLITIKDASGAFVAERDNDPGLYFDCRFEHTFASAGTYTVEVRDARYHGSEHGFYVLRMGRFPAVRVAVPSVVKPAKRADLRLPELANEPINLDVGAVPAAGLFYGVLKRPKDEGSTWLPLEANDAEITAQQEPNVMQSATTAKVPGVLCGVLQKPGEKHYFRFELAKGQKVQVRADAHAFNSPADLELALVDKDGKELRRVGENAQEEVVLDFNSGTGGVFGVRVSDVNRDGGPAFAYRLDVRVNQPHIEVTADVEGLTLPRGDYQTVPLSVTRVDYNGPIALSLLGAPPGVSLSPSEIGEGVKELVCKLSASSEGPLGLSTLQILARPTAHPDAVPTLVRTRPLIDRQIINVDLIPHALREDQHRLPPALTDRFALQLTPPTPFSVEAPETLVTLGRYMHTDFPIMITRMPGFSGPITFAVKGGQLAKKDDIRSRVYPELPQATSGQLRVSGSFHSRILTNTTKHRVDLTATAMDQDRRISLTRAFELDVRHAYAVNAELAKLSLFPGSATKIRLNAERLKPFDGDIAVLLQSSPAQGLPLPEKIVIPRGQTGVDIDINVPADAKPGRFTVYLYSTAVVNSFEEDQRGRQLEIDIQKAPATKK